MNEPITHGPVSRIAEKLCKCNGCGQTGICGVTVDDFYTRPKDGPEGPLYCLACVISADSMVRHAKA